MTEFFTKEAIVEKEFCGARVDVVLAQVFPEYSRSQLTQWLKQGSITINGGHCKPKDKVHGGEYITLTIAELKNEQHAPEDIPLNIVFEDEHLLIINKPAGLIVHPGAGNPAHTLVNALLHYEPSLQQVPRAGVIHRLDKDTTGLIIIAKTLISHTALIRMMQARDVQRRYLSLVYGNVIAGKRIETFLGRHPRNRLKMAVTQQGKEAVTEFSVKKRYEQFTLLEVQLLTGRTHQIRVHMAHIHHPVVGDPLYSGRVRFPRAISPEIRGFLEQFNRQALHAYSLSFIHPMSEKELTFKAALPDDFQSLLTILDNDA